MQKRTYSREFKLDIVRQIASGQKRSVQICREYNLGERMLFRWCKEYREQGENAFQPQKRSNTLTQEELERKRAWDRIYYQRHQSQRRSAVYERRRKFNEYLQQTKAQASCAYCNESHPATLQFHHRDPAQKEFNVSEFAKYQSGGIEKLKKEIEKCDIVCANCHLKYHYYHNQKKSPTAPETIFDCFERLERESILISESENTPHNFFSSCTDFHFPLEKLFEICEQ